MAARSERLREHAGVLALAFHKPEDIQKVLSAPQPVAREIPKKWW